VASITDVFDLGRLRLNSGEGRRLELDVRVDPLELAGQRYSAGPGPHVVVLDVSHTTSGYSLRLRYDVRLHGPCFKCLEDADAPISVDAREVDQPGGGDDMRSPYVEGDELDLRSWAKDALALALPQRILCREDCAGLCVECGANLNEAGPEHRHEQPASSPFAKLNELKLD
jgi:DUF177 domain-containing protein